MEWTNADPKGPNVLIMYKNGDGEYQKKQIILLIHTSNLTSGTGACLSKYK